MGGGIRAALLGTQGLFAREQTLAERASLSPLEEGIPFEPISLIRGESRGMLRDPSHAASNRTAEVRGSNPLGSTNDFNELKPRSICRQISPEAYRKQENRIRSWSKIGPISALKNSHFESWRERVHPGFDRVRATKLLRDSLGGECLDRVTGFNSAYVLMRSRPS